MQSDMSALISFIASAQRYIQCDLFIEIQHICMERAEHIEHIEHIYYTYSYHFCSV